MKKKKTEKDTFVFLLIFKTPSTHLPIK